jgi:hypothetical protein
VKVTRSYPDGERVESERLRQEQKQLTENITAISAAATASVSQSLVQGNRESCEEPQDKDGCYEYEDDFEVSLSLLK